MPSGTWRSAPEGACQVQTPIFNRWLPFPENGTFATLPIRTIDFSDPDDVAHHDRMVELVERMLSLHKGLAPARTPAHRTAIQFQIDRLVYELYGLTDEEIKIVDAVY